jgi:hypothetical protein
MLATYTKASLKQPGFDLNDDVRTLFTHTAHYACTDASVYGDFVVTMDCKQYCDNS